MKKIATIFALLFFLLVPSSQANIGPRFDQNLHNGLTERLKGLGLSESEIAGLFADKRLSLYPEMFIKKKGKPIGYFDPAFGLFSFKSIEAGKKLLTEKTAVLKKAEERFGVSAAMIAAIFRLETNFGQILGSRPVFNNLYTLSVFRNSRSDFFQNEFIRFVVLCRENSWDPFEIKGSWAGAFGLPQFMPSSFNAYALDGNGDGKVDLFNADDAIFSVANYLRQNGFRPENYFGAKKAVFAYNHSDTYVLAVLSYAAYMGWSYEGAM